MSIVTEDQVFSSYRFGGGTVNDWAHEWLAGLVGELLGRSMIAE